MKQSMIILLVSGSICLGAGRFVLESELCTNFAGNGSTTQFLTGYTYDAGGNRVLQRVWSGLDSMAAPLSAVTFTYNGSGAVTEEMLLAGADTLTIVRYAYAGGKLVAVRTLTKSGTVRFTDSLIYDELGRNIEEQRITSGGVKTQYRRYTLNAQGNIRADSLFELVSGSYVATQAVLITYNADLTVASQAQWRMSGAAWYCINTTFMAYAAGLLVTTATYGRDGVGTSMIDSLVYNYDINGNRIREEDYDGDRKLARRIVYTWRETQQMIVLMGVLERNNHRSVISSIHGRLTVDLPPQCRGAISLYSMDGRRVYRTTVFRSGVVPVHGLAGKGPYAAVFTSGTYRQIVRIPIMY